MEKLTYLERLAKHGVNSAHPGGLKLTKDLLKNETISATTAILDVGCGTGQTSAYIGTHYPCKVVAVDINPQMLEKAKQKFTKYQLDIPLVQANAMDLPFRKNSFDIILSESVTAFTQIPRTIREYYRVLKPGGILLEIEGTALLQFTPTEAGDLQSALAIDHLPTKEEWCNIFQKSGFSDVQVISERPMSTFGAVSPLALAGRVFNDFFSIMSRYRRKLGFGVYRCQK